MKKSAIANAIKGILEKGNQDGKPLLEIQFIAINTTNKNRICFCFRSNEENFTDLKDDIILRVDNSKFQINFKEYRDINVMCDEYRNISFDSSKVENNWRGRLFSYENYFTKPEEERENFLLKSIWRIIVEEGPSGDFFVRRDIFPYIWSYGHSIGGTEQYISSVRSEIAGLIERKEHFVDLTYDYFKVFAKKNNVRTFTSVILNVENGSNKYEYKLDFLENNIDLIINNVENGLNNYF